MYYNQEKLSETEHVGDPVDDERALEGKYLVDREDETEEQAARPVTGDQGMDDESWFTDELDPGGVEELRFD